MTYQRWARVSPHAREWNVPLGPECHGPRVLNAGLLLTVVMLLVMLVGRLQAADPAVLTAPVYINVGGSAVADIQGNLWLADQAFSASMAYSYVDFVSSTSSVSVGGPGIVVSGTENDLV